MGKRGTGRRRQRVRDTARQRGRRRLPVATRPKIDELVDEELDQEIDAAEDVAAEQDTDMDSVDDPDVDETETGLIDEFSREVFEVEPSTAPAEWVSCTSS